MKRAERKEMLDERENDLKRQLDLYQERFDAGCNDLFLIANWSLEYLEKTYSLIFSELDYELNKKNAEDFIVSASYIDAVKKWELGIENIKLGIKNKDQRSLLFGARQIDYSIKTIWRCDYWPGLVSPTRRNICPTLYHNVSIKYIDWILRKDE